MVLRSAPDGAEVLTVHRPRYDDWTFPKGKDEPGEIPAAAALREVLEETGYRCRIIAQVGEATYPLPTGGPKLVQYFAMRPLGGTFAPNGEVDEIRWLSKEEAGIVLSYEHDRRLLAGLDLGGLLRTGAVFLVRHGAAGDRELWEGDDRLRPLSKKGRRQAEGLVETLRDAGIERLISSPHLRCRQTLEPLAAVLGLPIEEDDGLAEGAGGKPAHELVEELAGSKVVLCSHGDVIPALLDRLVQRGMRLERAFEAKKGSTWEVEVEAGTFTRARYLPPPEV